MHERVDSRSVPRVHVDCRFRVVDVCCQRALEMFSETKRNAPPAVMSHLSHLGFATRLPMMKIRECLHQVQAVVTKTSQHARVRQVLEYSHSKGPQHSALSRAKLA